jgi:hypothetical protein
MTRIKRPCPASSHTGMREAQLNRLRRGRRDARYAFVTNALKFVFLTRRASALASAKNTGKTARHVCLRLCRAVRLTVV